MALPIKEARAIQKQAIFIPPGRLWRSGGFREYRLENRGTGTPKEANLNLFTPAADEGSASCPDFSQYFAHKRTVKVNSILYLCR
jgi:hypothetical protein